MFWVEPGNEMCKSCKYEAYFTIGVGLLWVILIDNVFCQLDMLLPRMDWHCVGGAGG